MEKILVKNDSYKAEHVISELQEKCSMINNVIPSLLKANDIELTPDNFQMALLNPKGIKKVYYSTLNEKINNFPKVLQITARQEADNAINNMLDTLNELELSYIEKRYIVFSGTICKVNVDAIKENFKRYITDAKEIEVFNLVKQAANVLNELFKGDIPLNWTSIFMAENGKLKVNEDLNFDYFANRK